jgi:phosphoribosylanthranilate isomerase
MALQYSVKLSQVTNLTDARYAAGMGVKFIGYSFEPADLENEALLTQRSEIAQWIVGPQIVIEENGLNAQQVEALYNALPVAFLQTRNLKIVTSQQLIYPILLTECCLKEMDSVLAEYPDTIFLITLIGIEIFPQIEQYLIDYCLKYKIILTAPEINSTEFLELIEKVKPYGIELAGGEEERPGYRDMGEMMDILEAIEIEG